MESLRKRAMEARAADAARNRLMEELLQQVDDMQKKMDRNAFTLVLIDGDSMNFLDDLVKKGVAGGSEASTRLRQRVFNALRHDADFRHDEKIVIEVYANLRGLSNLYVQKGLVSSTDEFANFVLGFNKAHPLCDFVDAGNHKESADKKLQETLDLHVYNVHCKHIIFGGSTDNAYASFLSSYDDVDASRIRLLKGPPFAFEFHSILHKYKQIEFTNVFRSEKLSPSRIDLSTRSRVPPRTKSPPSITNTAPSLATSKNTATSHAATKKAAPGNATSKKAAPGNATSKDTALGRATTPEDDPFKPHVETTYGVFEHKTAKGSFYLDGYVTYETGINPNWAHLYTKEEAAALKEIAKSKSAKPFGLITPAAPPVHATKDFTTDSVRRNVNPGLSISSGPQMHNSAKHKEPDPPVFKRSEDIPPHLRRWPAHMIPTPYSGMPSA